MPPQFPQSPSSGPRSPLSVPRASTGRTLCAALIARTTRHLALRGIQSGQSHQGRRWRFPQRFGLRRVPPPCRMSQVRSSTAFLIECAAITLRPITIHLSHRPRQHRVPVEVENGPVKSQNVGRRAWPGMKTRWPGCRGGRSPLPLTHDGQADERN